MKKEELMVSFKTAKKLKEAGRNKECVFHYDGRNNNEIGGINDDEQRFYSDDELDELMKKKIYEAPTSDEIIEELPVCIDEYYQLVIKKDTTTYLFDYMWDLYEGPDYKRVDMEAESLSEASAKMWLRLKENKHL